MKFYVLFALIIYSAGVSSNAEKNEDIVIYNYGLHDCETFLNVDKSGDQKKVAGYKLWLGGFLSYHNLQLKYFDKEMIYKSMNEAVVDLEKVCQKNRKISFFDAAINLLENYKTSGIMETEEKRK